MSWCAIFMLESKKPTHVKKVLIILIIEPPHDKTNKMACVPSEHSDQPGHLPSLIRIFAVCMKRAWVLSYPLSTQQRLWSDWADAQADLSLHWAHSHFVGFVMRRLICCGSVVILMSTHYMGAQSFWFSHKVAHISEQQRFRWTCTSMQSRQN